MDANPFLYRYRECSRINWRKAASMRVCQPSPSALKCAITSCERRILIRSFGKAVRGRPRGFNKRSAVFLLKICGNTSPAKRAYAASSCDHCGLSRSAFSGLLFLLIQKHLTLICLAQTNHMKLIGARRKHHRILDRHRPSALAMTPFTSLRGGRSPTWQSISLPSL